MVLFTALSMILLAFFIMLNSMATPDSARARQAMNSLVGTFGNLPGFTGQSAFIGEHKSAPKNQSDVYRTVQIALEHTSPNGLNVEKREDGSVVIGVGSDVLFNQGGIRVSPASFDTLDRIGELIVRLGLPTRIEGHADPVPSRGARSNWYLSAARAAGVYRYFDENFEVKPGQVTAAGYSSTRPDADGSRRPRVEVVFIPNSGGHHGTP